MAELARLHDVTLRFAPDAVPALDDIAATIAGGQITGLVGPDGAGKTTLLRLLTGLLLPTSGRVEVLGFDTGREPERIRAGLGYMPQRFGLYEDLSVKENLNLYADLRGLPDAERAPTFERLLRFTDLARFERRLAGRLSGGMKQKLGLACALLRRPRLLLLDEPSVGVDPISRRELWAMVEELTADGIGVLWSTAYLDEAEKCTHVLLLNEGKLLFEGPPEQLSGRVKDRVVRVSGIEGRKRRWLADALERPGVIDGVVQGRSVRLVFAEGSARPDFEGEISPTAPRFEDGFIDILGGGPGGRSRLAEAMADRRDGREAVIEARGLTKQFGDFTAAQDVGFSVKSGEIFGLLGPNGAGKSTTFKMLCGLLRPSAGDGRVAGFDLRKEAAQARNHLGYMAQKFSLYGDLTVRQNLAFFAGVYGLRGARARSQIELMTLIFGLARLLDSPAAQLPLGFKQRLALACAVMHEPAALFLDEPTSGVDPITRREFWTHINGLVEKGVAVLVTTHFMDEAEYCDRLALIYRGQMIASGTPDDLKASIADQAKPDPSLEEAFIGRVERSNLHEAA